MMYAESFAKLITELQKLPGIGPKSAQRLAFHLLGTSRKSIDELAAAMVLVKERMRYCSVCYNITDIDPCAVCADTSRDDGLLCVVAEPKDLVAIERSGVYNGKYHVLGGVISPLDGIEPESLRIKELINRLKQETISELVLAINPTTEGEATSFYLTRLIKPLGVKLTRIAFGLPVGADMDYADPATLSKSLEGRREVV
ncbi:recombination protein RecR [candidate division WOR-1 bacterium RIFCSPHIGHO2_01_FULL_53_15]|uniref:Recombination protein RecR n=1 Tax=candidate division WOR-1 bacterium RIFCSPHIGHO2_01_FULL_53_15 TaxID=1802564 RepID=A0A1F4Q4B4_UNCSA|nr:MAG: recombination protein RecR [candidate division WOR-1 bacterium RIFCSPHIGHO2_01_FULL_53_15]OGC13235.1 MAG: recombination protein RecR [candidate division WOR-1 bacterium RIFCSPHIGHO2_02_FULL_53_26]